MSKDKIGADFDVWWHNEGSALHPLPGEDIEMHVHRVSEIAWKNGAYSALRSTLRPMGQLDDEK